MNLTALVSAHRTATASRALAVGLPRAGRLTWLAVGADWFAVPHDVTGPELGKARSGHHNVPPGTPMHHDAATPWQRVIPRRDP